MDGLRSAYLGHHAPTNVAVAAYLLQWMEVGLRIIIIIAIKCYLSLSHYLRLSIPLCPLSYCLSFYVCLSAYLYVCLSVFVSMYLCLCISVSLCICVFVSLCVCVSVCRCICLSICMSVCVSVSVCMSLCLTLSLPVSLSVCLSVCLSLPSFRCSECLDVCPKVKLQDLLVISRRDSCSEVHRRRPIPGGRK